MYKYQISTKIFQGLGQTEICEDFSEAAEDKK